MMWHFIRHKFYRLSELFPAFYANLKKNIRSLAVSYRSLYHFIHVLHTIKNILLTFLARVYRNKANKKNIYYTK